MKKKILSVLLVLMMCAGCLLIPVSAAGDQDPVAQVEPVAPYYALYDILAAAFYGDGAQLTGNQDLVITTMATTLVVLCFAIPFIAAFWFGSWAFRFR